MEDLGVPALDHCAPLTDVFDPHTVTSVQERLVACPVFCFCFCPIVHVCPSWVKLGWDDRDGCSNLSAHGELCWTVSVRQRSGAVGHEAKVRITGLQETFDCP